MRRYISLLLIYLFTFNSFAQFSGNTVKQIDEIKSNGGTDIILNPNDKVDINYFTGEKALQSTVDGELEESAITNTELNHLSGSTSNIQGQLNLKAESARTFTTTAPLTIDGGASADLTGDRTLAMPQASASQDGYLSSSSFSEFAGKQDEITGTAGDLFYYNTILTALGIGTEGQLLTVSSGFPSWQDAPISTTLDTKGQIQGYSTVNANIGPCANDQILIFDNAEATGWKCADVPAQSPTTTIGDIIYNNTGTASGDTRLAIGTEGQLLTVASGVPTWQDAPVSTTLSAKGDIQTHDGTSNATFTANADGNIIFYNSATTTGLDSKPYSPLTAKADIYTYDGTSEASFSAGADGDIIYYDSATTTGLNTKPYSPLTTEGDLYIFNADNDRLPKGNHGSFLMVDDNASPKIKWYDAVTVKDYDDNPVGTVIAYGSTNVPAGYLLADGTCYKKLDYEQLFNVIGTSAGECTVTTTNDGFNVPNLQNQFLRGLTGGRSVFDTQTDATALPNNAFTTNNDSHYHTISNGVGGGLYAIWYAGGGSNLQNSGRTSTDTHNHTVTGGGDSETRPANIAVVYMIKAEGREPIFGVEKKGLSPNKAGFIIWSAFNATPEGHRLANGDCILKTDYPQLFENISTTFGECTISVSNDGFNLPDLVTDNRFIRAAGGSIAHGSTATDTTAINGLQATHKHKNVVSGSGVGTDASTGSIPDGVSNSYYFNSYYKDVEPDGMDTSTVDAMSSGDTETAPNNIALTPFIKMYNNDVITGVFEQIEEVIVEQDASNVNEFSARINSGGGVSSENFDFIDGNCTEVGAVYTCTFQSGVFTQIPSCTATADKNSTDFRVVMFESISTTTLIAETRNQANVNNPIAWDLHCSKQGVDVNKLTQNRVIKDSTLEHYNLGDCKYSILDTTQFSTLHTGKWVRLEGQSIAGTDVANEFGITTLPNAVSNGAFIRQVGGNSAALRTFQDDKTDVNGLNIPSSGAHGHDLYASNSPTGSGAPRQAATDDGNPTVLYPNAITSVQSAHDHAINSTDNETAPKNIALNFYCLVSY